MKSHSAFIYFPFASSGVEMPLVKVDVRPADFARQGLEQYPTGREFRKGLLAQLEWGFGGIHPDRFGVSHNPLLITVRLPRLGHVRATFRVL